MNRRSARAAASAAAVGIAGAALLAAGCGGSEPKPTRLSATLPSDFFGVVSEDAFKGTPAYRRSTLAQQARIGVGLLRQTFDWSQIETARGQFDFSRYDGVVADAARAGMEVMPIVQKPPPFRAAAVRGAPPNATLPPRKYSDFGAFVQRLDRRYGSRGSFWSSHPNLPQHPIRYWQIWNEPSLPAYWGHPDPAAYTRLLKEAASALRRSDPRAVVVSAGIPQSRIGMPFDKFLNGMYDAGAASAFDVLAVHPYARDDPDVLAAVEQARKIMRSHGDAAPIWVTELGWASGGPPNAFLVGKLGQAQRIDGSFRLLADHRSQLGIRGLVYYNWRDNPRPPGYPDFFGLHTGLYDVRGRPKPAFFAFRRTVRSLLRRYGSAQARRLVACARRGC